MHMVFVTHDWLKPFFPSTVPYMCHHTLHLFLLLMSQLS